MSEDKTILNIADEMRVVIARTLDDAEIMKGFAQLCAEREINFSQLKSIVTAQEQDHRDGGDRLKNMMRKTEELTTLHSILNKRNSNV